MTRRWIIALLMVAALTGCDRSVQVPYNKQSADSTAQRIVELNTMLQSVEEYKIDSFVRSHSDMAFEPSGTGYYLAMKKMGTGRELKEGDDVCIEYRILQLDGTLLYDYTGMHSRTQKVGSGRRNRALNEALKQMKEGGSAVVVTPSLYAYGALGDKKKILPRTPLVYEIETVTKK
ncbi:MAG: FKBP-type peptidyl-prolyl cis-trans isomerase [Paludibacteraceae bacterium]|nr:FKBP-type peptidyl-prolyl cis-trans isomerase [Paludibacteraceae bacterium]